MQEGLLVPLCSLDVPSERENKDGADVSESKHGDKGDKQVRKQVSDPDREGSRQPEPKSVKLKVISDDDVDDVTGDRHIAAKYSNDYVLNPKQHKPKRKKRPKPVKSSEDAVSNGAGKNINEYCRPENHACESAESNDAAVSKSKRTKPIHVYAHRQRRNNGHRGYGNVRDRQTSTTPEVSVTSSTKKSNPEQCRNDDSTDTCNKMEKKIGPSLNDQPSKSHNANALDEASRRSVANSEEVPKVTDALIHLSVKSSEGDCVQPERMDIPPMKGFSVSAQPRRVQEAYICHTRADGYSGETRSQRSRNNYVRRDETDLTQGARKHEYDRATGSSWAKREPYRRNYESRNYENGRRPSARGNLRRESQPRISQRSCDTANSNKDRTTGQPSTEPERSEFGSHPPGILIECRPSASTS